MINKKIIVVGGGTAGWLSALFAKQSFPDCDVTVIDSSSVDIIGVGESTTPPIIDIFDFLGISVADLIKNCGATMKDSIRFTNWNGDGEFYHHGFNTYDPSADLYVNSNLSMHSTAKLDWPVHKPLMAISQMYKRQNLDALHLSAVASRKNKIPFSFLPEHERTNSSINHFYRHAAVALHFNARLVAEYLKKIAIKRGIKHIDGLVAESLLDEHGNVIKLHLKQGQKIDCDFVFDCTGFARIFVDKTYKSKFKSYKDFLPVDRAIPFFVDMKGETPPYTEAISMKNGWMWKIPVQGRFGCGYVYDSNYTDDKNAYKELCEIIGEEPDAPRVISFTPGYYTTPWNKNVLAVGLSSGFIEPLEASSIWITTISLALFAENISGFINQDQESINEYNKNFIKNTDSVLNLVHTHYHNDRNDTDFWKEFKEKNKTPESMEEIKQIIATRLPSTKENNLYNVFPADSWYIVGAGNNIFSRSIIEKEYNTYNISTIEKQTMEFKKHLEGIIDNCVSHDVFLDYLRNN